MQTIEALWRVWLADEDPQEKNNELEWRTLLLVDRRALTISSNTFDETLLFRFFTDAFVFPTIIVDFQNGLLLELEFNRSSKEESFLAAFRRIRPQ